MNRSLNDVGGGLLVVSQFTLYGDVGRGGGPALLMQPSRVASSV
ncbi:MAG: hypothetical protein Ct9H300mP15_18430 [Gemmatimonadota bacterium]|nr:MAG: hypothetical protein Ct9H300mP15_18430 [Gemmatimonadota bacterium]